MGGDVKEALLSLMKQSFTGPYEVIVVDNRSTDHTKSVVLEFQQLVDFPIHYVYEERLGLSVARNTAIRRSSGEYVLFLDDDAVASKDWIRGIVALFDGDSRIGCVGGKIIPAWEGSAPQWLPEENRTLYTILDYAEDIVEMTAGHTVRRERGLPSVALRRDGSVPRGSRPGGQQPAVQRGSRADRADPRPAFGLLHALRIGAAQDSPQPDQQEMAAAAHLLAGSQQRGFVEEEGGILLKSLVKLPVFAVLTVVFAYDKRKIFRNISKLSYSNGQLRGVLKMYQ